MFCVPVFKRLGCAAIKSTVKHNLGAPVGLSSKLEDGLSEENERTNFSSSSEGAIVSHLYGRDWF